MHTNPKDQDTLQPFAVDLAGSAWPGSQGRPASNHVFTIFHGFVIFGVCAGLGIGLAGGAKLFGVAGGMAGALAGGCAGFIIGRLPMHLALRSLTGSLRLMTSDELRCYLRSQNCLTPNLVLLELQRRGEDTRPELDVVLDLLGSEEIGWRGRGWAALTSAFPKLAGQLGDYRLGDSTAECRRKTERLRIKPAG